MRRAVRRLVEIAVGTRLAVIDDSFEFERRTLSAILNVLELYGEIVDSAWVRIDLLPISQRLVLPAMIVRIVAVSRDRKLAIAGASK